LAQSDAPQLVWSGRYGDGRTAAFHIVEARIGDGGLIIDGGNPAPRAFWPFDEIRLIDEPEVNGAIRLARFGGDERLSLQQRDALRALALHCAKLHDGMGGESSWRVIAAWCGAAVAAVAFLILVVIPFLARHASQWVSPRLEAELGERMVGIVTALTVAPEDKDHAECTAPRGRAAIETLVAPLTAQLSLRNPARVRVINSKLVNALALPGGQILLFRGLIDFAEGPNEVAGVIGHELGHLKLDHPMTLVIQQSGTAFVIGLALGDIFGGSAVAVGSAGIVDSAFSREAESAADAQAVALLTGAGLDVAPLGAFFARLGAKQLDGDVPIAFLRTHPPSAERAQLIAAAPHGGRQALTAAQWQDLKAICQ